MRIARSSTSVLPQSIEFLICGKFDSSAVPWAVERNRGLFACDRLIPLVAIGLRAICIGAQSKRSQRNTPKWTTESDLSGAFVGIASILSRSCSVGRLGLGYRLQAVSLHAMTLQWEYRYSWSVVSGEGIALLCGVMALGYCSRRCEPSGVPLSRSVRSFDSLVSRSAYTCIE